MEHYERVYNVCLYLLLFEYDFTLLKNDALFALTPWRKRFVARLIAAQLYEASQDLPRLLGRDFRESLNEIGVDSQHVEELNRISSKLNVYKNENREALKDLRNSAISHRDKDAARQLVVIEEVELLSVMELGGDLYEPIRELVPYLTKIIIKMGSPGVILKHMRFDDPSMT